MRLYHQLGGDFARADHQRLDADRLGDVEQLLEVKALPNGDEYRVVDILFCCPRETMGGWSKELVAINEAIKPFGAVPALKALVPVLANLPATTPRPPLLPLPDGAVRIQERLAAIAGQ